jgi:hypothetical protein
MLCVGLFGRSYRILLDIPEVPICKRDELAATD